MTAVTDDDEPRSSALRTRRHVDDTAERTPIRVGRGGIARIAIALVVIQLAFFALLVLAQLVPDEPIVRHLLEAVDDGTYGPTGRPDNMGGTATSFDECVLVGTGLGRPDLGAFESAVRMPRIGSCGTGAADLAALERGETPANVSEYFRYWAGWTVIARPVLALFGIEALRRISGALLVVSWAIMLVALRRRSALSFTIALTLPLLLASNVLATPSTSLNQSLSLAAAFVSPTLTVIGGDRGRTGALLGAAVGAAVYCYIDLMLVPAVPWMLSAAGAAAVCDRARLQPRAAFRRGVEVAIVWPVAFAFTWASRWVFAVAFLGWDHAMSVIRSKIGFRLAGESTSVEPGIGRSTRVNYDYWLANVSTAPVVLLASALVVTAALVVACRRFGPVAIARFGLVAWPAGLTFLWYEIVRNHSQIHPGKAHISIPVALGVVVAAALLAASSAPAAEPSAPDARDHEVVGPTPA